MRRACVLRTCSRGREHSSCHSWQRALMHVSVCRARAEEAESKLAPLQIRLAQCARKARRHALEEIGELKADLSAKQAEITALKDQVSELCATKITALSTSAQTSANKSDLGPTERLEEAERQLRVENSSLILQVKALVAVIADLKAEKAHQQAYMDILVCHATALKMQTEQMSAELVDVAKCLGHELQQSTALLVVCEEQNKAAHDRSEQLQGERLQMVEQVSS